jgi:hypothetical protein
MGIARNNILLGNIFIGSLSTWRNARNATAKRAKVYSHTLPAC